MEKYLAPNPEAVKIALRSMLEFRHRWDQPPELGTIYSTDDGTVTTRDIPIPERLWEQSGHPKNLLRGLARALHQRGTSNSAQSVADLPAMVPDNLCGLYLVVEGWTLPQAELQEAHRRTRETGAPMPRFEENPRRVETRMVNAVDSAGWKYFAQNVRGQREIMLMNESEINREQVISGAIPALLWDLVTGFTPGARRRAAPPKGYVSHTFRNQP